ncbi:sensor domain-containing protein [Naasia sp. SYSU D00948]|uniref:sensor domain-containing protein n=1 Tax=Naasia sp. SYSU D00948 TaxID=2817379 RepID=UPI001B315BD5|nr:sensor domain-containing protein [Naasia sp. SYSU D00948]
MVEYTQTFEQSGEQAISDTRAYAQAVRELPRNLVFLLTEFPVAIAVLTVLVALSAAGVSTVIVWVGVPLLASALWLAHRAARLSLRRLRWIGRKGFQTASSRRVGGLFRRTFLDPQAWLRLTYGVAVAPLAAAVSWAVTVVWVAAALGGLTYWAWSAAIPRSVDTWRLSVVLGDVVGVDGAGLGALDAVLYVAVGAVLLLALPRVLTVLVDAHHFLARAVIRL